MSKTKKLKTKVIDGKLVELTPMGNAFEMTMADAQDMYEKMGKKSFEEFQKWDYPYAQFSEKKALSELKSLRNKQNGDTCASHIIKTVHKHRYSCLRGEMKSPIEYWDFLKQQEQFDNENWKKFYINRLRNAQTSAANEFRKDGIMRASTIEAGLTITHRADTPSYFKPHLAKRLIKTYLDDFSEVFCPFNGFSGMLLGCVVGCGKAYVGQDLNAQQIDEAKQIADFIKAKFDSNVKISLSVKDLFEDKGQYQCLIACPPYGDKDSGNIEKWNFDSNGNCLDKSLDCDQWIDECLKRYKCKKYVFVVDEKTTNKYKPFIKEQLTNRCHFGSNVEYVVVITEDEVMQMRKVGSL